MKASAPAAVSSHAAISKAWRTERLIPTACAVIATADGPVTTAMAAKRGHRGQGGAEGGTERGEHPGQRSPPQEPGQGQHRQGLDAGQEPECPRDLPDVPPAQGRTEGGPNPRDAEGGGGCQGPKDIAVEQVEDRSEEDAEHYQWQAGGGDQIEPECRGVGDAREPRDDESGGQHHGQREGRDSRRRRFANA